jgi:glycerophosphoryl diester phosphodiesterase/predicted amidohydrolase
MDLIVLPEYSDVLADVQGKAEYYDAVNTYGPLLLERAQTTAKRCASLVFVNAGYSTAAGVRNTTYAINRNGEIIGHYFKAHPAPSEVKTDAEGGHELDTQYSYEYRPPYILETEGIRFGFLTCYDFYFYENFAKIALENVDVIIGCSLQRTDTHDALSIINRFLCYHTNAYLVRSSVSLGEDSNVCGCSMIVSPKGEELLNMKNQVGLGVYEIHPKEKYYKAAGHLGACKSHYEYIEEGRRPWLYRNGGASVVPFEAVMKYHRICAHRGFNTIAPENSLPAFGAAVALGAEEIEFDIWSTKDNVLVSCHDSSLERVSDGSGKIYNHTYNELLTLDFGIKYGEEFRGLKICTFEEILQKFAGRVIMNIHVKIWDSDFPNTMMKEIVELIRKYDCVKHVYFMTTNDRIIREVMCYAPDICVCVGWDGNKDPLSIVERAIALGAKKVQLFKPYFNQHSIDMAHEHGILCNVFWADDPKEAITYRSMGIDCILTNDYLAIKNALAENLAKQLPF